MIINLGDNPVDDYILNTLLYLFQRFNKHRSPSRGKNTGTISYVSHLQIVSFVAEPVYSLVSVHNKCCFFIQNIIHLAIMLLYLLSTYTSSKLIIQFFHWHDL